MVEKRAVVRKRLRSMSRVEMLGNDNDEKDSAFSKLSMMTPMRKKMSYKAALQWIAVQCDVAEYCAMHCSNLVSCGTGRIV